MTNTDAWRVGLVVVTWLLLAVTIRQLRSPVRRQMWLVGALHAIAITLLIEPLQSALGIVQLGPAMSSIVGCMSLWLFWELCISMTSVHSNVLLRIRLLAGTTTTVMIGAVVAANIDGEARLTRMLPESYNDIVLTTYWMSYIVFITIAMTHCTVLLVRDFQADPRRDSLQSATYGLMMVSTFLLIIYAACRLGTIIFHAPTFRAIAFVTSYISIGILMNLLVLSRVLAITHRMVRQRRLKRATGRLDYILTLLTPRYVSAQERERIEALDPCRTEIGVILQMALIGDGLLNLGRTERYNLPAIERAIIASRIYGRSTTGEATVAAALIGADQRISTMPTLPVGASEVPSRTPMPDVPAGTPIYDAELRWLLRVARLADSVPFRRRVSTQLATATRRHG